MSLSVRVALAFAAFCLLFAAAAGLFLFCFPQLGGFMEVDSEKTELPMPTRARRRIILDAGHGGIDGGASTRGGICEKDLNLQITNILANLLTQCGYEVTLTRTDDEMLSDDGEGSRKMRDLRARLDIAREQPDALFISIHMNTYPSQACRGLQVYYTKNDTSARELASAVQSTVHDCLQPDNTRAIKAADSSIYLLDRSTSCAILIECGFLSCDEEAALLAAPDYQQRLAAAIANAIVSYTQKEL